MYRIWKATIFIPFVLAACERDGGIINPRVVPEDRAPDWHPTLPMLVFQTRDVTMQESLVTYDMPTGIRTTVLASSAYSPDWHPMEPMIAFSAGGRLAVWGPERDIEFLTPADEESFNPRWSPDGSTIAHVSNADPTLAYSIWILDVESGSNRRLLLGGQPMPGGDEPTWAPHGDSIIVVVPFPTSSVTNRARLLLVGLGSADTAYVTPADYDAHVPAWHPDGSHVSYRRSLPGQVGDIWLLDLRDGSQSLLVENAISATWSPSGDSLAFSRRSTDAIEIWMLDLATGEEKRLTSPLM